MSSSNSGLFDIFSNKAEKSENVPHIIQALDCLPPHTILVGEIYYPGGSSKNCTEIMGCLPAKAIERQNGKWGQIHYYLQNLLSIHYMKQ